MKTESPMHVRIVDCLALTEYEKYLYKCLAPMPFKRYTNRKQYLAKAIPKGFQKKLLIMNGDAVGSIEFAPADASGYPISGDDIIVLNCLWVLRKAKGHGFGKLLVNEMLKSQGQATGFATIALEGHWSPWFKKEQIERLGFRTIDSIRVAHKTKHPDQTFTVHLMWMPRKQAANQPKWDKEKILHGETYCLAHPLYRPQAWKGTVLSESSAARKKAESVENASSL